MKRYRLLLVFLISAALMSDHAAAQEIEPPVLVGIGKGNQKEMEQLSHLYAIDVRVVYAAAKIGTPVLSRAFVSATTHKHCCSPAEKVATNCWYCCDSTVFCTDDAAYSSMVAKSTEVSDKEWEEVQAKGFDSIKGWSEINKLLAISPPLEVSKDDPLFSAFLKKMSLK